MLYTILLIVGDKNKFKIYLLKNILRITPYIKIDKYEKRQIIATYLLKN